jgi:hypothetical protein
MKHSFVIAALLTTYSWPVAGDSVANASVPIALVYEQELLPIDVQRGSFVTPTFKFFNRNTLVGLLSGGPTNNNTLSSALHTLPSGYAKETLTKELAKVHLSAPVDGKAVLIYVMNGACPPCDHIIEEVKAQLPVAGWTRAHILVINIARDSLH